VAGVSNAGTRGSVALGRGGAVAYDPGDAFVGLAEGETDTDSFRYTVADDAGGESAATVTVTVTGANDAPAFTGEPAPTVVEGTRVVPMAFTDPEEDPLTLAVTGGADAALFTIDAANQLVFAAAPDHEGPVDAEGDNVYLVQVTASDGAGATDLQDLTVTVVNDPADDDPADSENSGSEGDMGMAVLDFLM
jgi:uncharacterized protein